MQTFKQNLSGTYNEIKSYSFPKLYTGKEWYIGFMAFDPASGKMKRKKIKLNHIEKKGDRRQYADAFIKRLTVKLEKGWNPWIEVEYGKSYQTFKDACDHYRKYITKMLADNIYREDTYTSYISYLRNIEAWNANRTIPITYIYQFNRELVMDFLEYIHIDKNNSAQTRNNYLGFISIFSTFLLQHQYITVKPTEGISKISKRNIKKQRTIIDDKTMIRIYDYLNNKNKHFLLASYILHYCFIRPKEMSMIKIQDISLKNRTIYIPEDNSKNRKDGTVTMPIKVIHLMLDLRIFDNPGSYYLFSDKFLPGKKQKNEKHFRDFWTNNVRKDLKLPATYKFYSLKDTGITSMLRKYDTLTVRDQARHANVLMTDAYTPHDIQQANELIMKHEGVF